MEIRKEKIVIELNGSEEIMAFQNIVMFALDYDSEHNGTKLRKSEKELAIKLVKATDIYR